MKAQTNRVIVRGYDILKQMSEGLNEARFAKGASGDALGLSPGILDS